VRTFDVDTTRGAARVDLDLPSGQPHCLVVLGHGAAGGVDAPDLLAVRAAMLDKGGAVARVTQPYRVAGRRSPAPAPALDEAFEAVVAELRTDAALAGIPLVVGGRSSGARVACRTARAVGAVGIVALAFPLQPPTRRGAGSARSSRAGELESGVPTLVVNGDRDSFGVPEPSTLVEVCVRPGERHDLRRDPAGVAAVVMEFLVRHGWLG
jgi:uncharacterized protein